MTIGRPDIDPAAAARIAAALQALETELAAAGVPQDVREDLIILLAAQRREERTRPDRDARLRRIAAQRLAAAAQRSAAGGVR